MKRVNPFGAYFSYLLSCGSLASNEGYLYYTEGLKESGTCCMLMPS